MSDNNEPDLIINLTEEDIRNMIEDFEEDRTVHYRTWQIIGTCESRSYDVKITLGDDEY